MIKVGLTDHIIESKPSEPSEELKRLAKEIEAMSQTKEWQDFLSQYGKDKKTRRRGRV